MTTDNVSHVPPIQCDFSNSAQVNRDPASVNATALKPVIRTQEPHQASPATSANVFDEPDEISDCLVWSGINVVFGAIVLGIPLVILSILTKKYRREGDLVKAEKLSKIVLVSNIIVSFLSACGLIYLITHFQMYG